MPDAPCVGHRYDAWLLMAGILHDEKAVSKVQGWKSEEVHD